MRKFGCFVLAAILCVCPFAGCKNSKKPETIAAPKELMFQIDEGIAGKELMSVYKDSPGELTAALKNICESLAPLKVKYDVSALISPIWVYSETGYAGGGSASVGANRIHPAMKTTLDYLAQKGIGVYIEMYSSDIYTNQNGELGRLPIVKERYGSSREIKGLAIDLDCLEDLFDKYPVIKGIRYHELIGTHWIQDNGHGFKVEMDVVKGMADICKSKNKRLVWGDHMWSDVFTRGGFEFWQEIINYVCDTLGDGLTINFNNNSFDLQSGIQYEYTMADYRNNNRHGYSVQSWFWQSKDAQSLLSWPERPGQPTRWYPDAFFDMPVELMAAFTLETFKRGGTLVQYEPAVYWFNYFLPDPNAVDYYVGSYEKAPDYSGKLILKRLIDILLNYEKNPDDYPSMTPADYYAKDIKQLTNNIWDDRPKTYNQTTLGVIGDKTFDVLDTYVSNAGVWYENPKNRYREWVFAGDVTDVQRLNTEFRQIDEYIVVKNTTAGRKAEVYNHMSAYYTNCDNIVADDSNGVYLGFTALNLKRNNAMPLNGVQTERFFGDSDEIITARNNNGTVHFTVYVIADKAGNNPVRQDFEFVEDAALTRELNERFTVAVADYAGIAGHRSKNQLFVNNTKSIDNALLFTEDADGKVKVSGVLNGSKGNVNISKTLDIRTDEIVDISCGDYDLDCLDEIMILTDAGAVKVFSFDEYDDYNIFERKFEKIFVGAKMLYSLRWTTYYNQI